MQTPFEMLNIKESASDAEIKEAYLKLVRQYPPDRYPDNFKKIKQAYDTIKTLKDRLAYLLFNVPDPDPEALLLSVIHRAKSRINIDILLQFVLDLTIEEIKDTGWQN